MERHGGWWRVKMETDELPGFWLPPPIVSFEESLVRRFRAYRKQLYYTLMWRGVAAWPAELGVSKEEAVEVAEWLEMELQIQGPTGAARAPKAASKMVVGELRQELAGQGLPTDGNRAVLYARVQRARRLNKALGKPLWTPQTREPVMQASARVEYLLEHLTLDGTAASWPQEEGVRGKGGLLTSQLVGGAAGGGGGSAAGRAKAKSSDLYDDEDEGEVHAAAPAILAGSAAQAAEEDEEMQAFRAEEDLIPLSTTLDGIFTLEERWGHWWERADKERVVLPWSERMELDSAWSIFQLVIELGGVPALADCCMVLWAAVEGNDCRIMHGVVDKSHKIGHTFGINLYKTVVNTCLGLLEIDTAVAILEDMQQAGVQPGDDMWQHVEEARRVAAERVVEEQRRREAAEVAAAEAAAADVAAGAVTGEVLPFIQGEERGADGGEAAMYNGIGLQTARGSGTNGYVQANKFAIRHRHTKFEAKEFQEGAGTGGISRKANKEILEHDRKRQIELKLLLLRETLEEQGYLEEEIDEQMEQARAQLEAAMREESEDQALDSLGNQTHQIVARKEKKMETLKAALRINESAKEGDAFDRELQEQRRQERQLAREEAEEARRREEKEREKEERRREKQRRKEEKEMKKRLKKEEKARRRAEEEAAEREEEMRRKEKKARKLREAEEARRAEEAREAEARRAEEEARRREEEAERREAERLRGERKREEGRRKDEGETRRGDERRGRGREEEQAGERKKQRRDARATDAADVDDEGEDRWMAGKSISFKKRGVVREERGESESEEEERGREGERERGRGRKPAQEERDSEGRGSRQQRSFRAEPKDLSPNRRSASPKRRRSPSPKHYRAPSPRAASSPSPQRSRSPSPERAAPPTFKRARSPSPKRGRSPSPQRRPGTAL
ncbi:unnamed protein product [Closterium sp. Yama58-4]|nr:unnamed protein product [Closterium sp. Yama58-4]